MKPSHFLMSLHCGKKMHLKVESEEMGIAWVKSIQTIMEIYKNKTFPESDPGRAWKESLDLRVVYIIMEEIESSFL